jgi:hypothetical protein
VSDMAGEFGAAIAGWASDSVVAAANAATMGTALPFVLFRNVMLLLSTGWRAGRPPTPAILRPTMLTVSERRQTVQVPVFSRNDRRGRVFC